MLTYVNSILYIYIGVLLNKLNVYLVTLLQLNKLSLNIVILLCVFYFIFIVNNKFCISVVIVYSLSFSMNYLNFINSFIFGFFKIHILLFYITIIMGNFNILKHSYIDLRVKCSNILYLVVLSFFLGSLWSLYLFDWGYYWTNDSIEYVLLLFILFLVVNIHLWNTHTYIYNVYTLLCVYMLLMLRLNIIHTRHNFFQQNTLVYVIIKLLFILSIQSFTFTKINYKFFIKKFNTTILLFFFIIFFIMVNYINFFSFKLFLYTVYSVVICLILLLTKWGILRYLYTHLSVFILYMCFVFLIPCYIFLFKISLLKELTFSYNVYLNKYFINLKTTNFYTFLNSLNNNLLFNKWKEVVWVNSNVSVFTKKLLNFIL